jgi:hypothetical protein
METILLRVGDSVQRRVAWFPVAWTKLIGLECIQDADDFGDVAAHTQVVNGQVTDDSLWIDQEDSAVSQTLFLVINAVVRRQFVGQVGQHDIFHAFEISMAVAPALVGIDAVGAGGQNSAFAVVELAKSFIERDQLGWTDEGEIEWIEEQTDPFAVVIGQFDIRELAIIAILRAIVRLNFEKGSFVTYADTQDFLFQTKKVLAHPSNCDRASFGQIRCSHEFRTFK